MSGPSGFLGSVKSLLATLVATVHNRVELFSTEFQEEMARLLAVLVWSIAALLSGVVGLTFAAVLLLLAVDESRRPLAAGILAATFLSSAFAFAWYVRRLLKARPRPFHESLKELEKDHESLKDER